MKMEQIECSETSAYKIQTPENYPEESTQLFYLCPELWSAISHVNPAWAGTSHNIRLGQNNDDSDTLYLEVWRNTFVLRLGTFSQFGINDKEVLITISLNVFTLGKD